MSRLEFLYPSNHFQEFRLGTTPKSSDDIMGSVPRPDLVQTLAGREILAIWSGSHIRVPKRVRNCRMLLRKLRGEHLVKPALCSFVQGAGVVGDQPRDAAIPSMSQQPPRSVQGMQTSVSDVRRVPDVMEPSRSHQKISLSRTDDHTEPRGLRTDGLDMLPSPG